MIQPAMPTGISKDVLRRHHSIEIFCWHIVTSIKSKSQEELLEFNLDELSRDMLVFRTELYELLKNSVVEINFNQDLFQDQLQFLKKSTKPIWI
ncbi:MAG: hypothetical protein R2822_11860 [Spirosomataceae bacterium]